MFNLQKLAEDVAMKVQEKLETPEERPSLFSKQMLAETGIDALEIALRKLLLSN